MEKKAVVVVLISFVLLMGFVGCALAGSAPSPFEGLKITPPDDSVSPDVRTLFGKSGKWGAKGGWDGLWTGTSGGAKSNFSPEPGYLAVLNLTSEGATVKFGWGKYNYECKARIETDKDVCLQVIDEIGAPFSRTGTPPQFCLKDGKMKGSWRGANIEHTISLVPLE